VVEIATGNEDFSILVAALTAAGLIDPLLEAGPITVFAPTNDAFEALLFNLETTPEALLADVPLLEEVLKYHVVPIPAFSSELADGQILPTLQGGNLTVSIGEYGVQIVPSGGPAATVIAADFGTDDGSVVHVIDTVLLP
jgi:uncharacterized surface protein with fasciclin (FAS1) repeats